LARRLQQKEVLDMKAFTLAPPSQGVLRYKIRSQLHDVAADRGLSYHDVLLSLNGGETSLDELRAFIVEDGKRRNLDWAVTDVKAVEPASGQPMAVSESRGEEPSSAAEDKEEESEVSFAGQPMAVSKNFRDESSSGIEDEEEEDDISSTTLRDENSSSDTVPDQYQKDMLDRLSWLQPRVRRFVLSFSSSSEARRFARNWHKRELHGPGRERRIVNVSLIW
jgi:hypothetical protein